MLKRVVLVCCLVALFVLLLVYGLSTDPRDDVREDAGTTADEAPALTGHADNSNVDASEEPTSPVEEPQGDGRRWTLECELQEGAGGSLGMMSLEWDEDAPEGSPYENEAVRVELRRGADVRVVARGTLDARGRALFELPELGTLSPLARASSQLHVLPESPKLRLAQGVRHMAYVFIEAPKAYYVVPPARPEGDAVKLRVIVPVGAGVTGRVLGEDGAPLEDAHVSIYSSDGGRASGACSAADGRFALSVSVAGTFSISVWGQDGAHTSRKGVRLAAGTSEDLGDFTVEHNEVFAGRVTYPDGKPVQGLAVRSSYIFLRMHVNYGFQALSCQTYGPNYVARTDKDGRFRISGGESNEALLWSFRADFEGNARYESVSDRGYSPKLGENLDAVLHGHRIRFRIVDAENGPVGDAEIVLLPVEEPKEDEDPFRPDRFTTAFDGTADAWFRPGSRWRASVISEGAAPLQQEIAVPTEGNESDLVLTLQAIDLDTGLRCFLEGPDGTALFPAVIDVKTPKGSSVWTRRSEKSGFFLALAPGDYNVHMWSIERSTWGGGGRWLHFRADATVEKGKKSDLRGRVSEAAHLEVTLRMAPGSDAHSPSHPRVFLEHTETEQRTSDFISGLWRGKATDVVNGELEPGVWTVRLQARGIRSVTRRIDLQAGRLNKIEFVLEPE